MTRNSPQYPAIHHTPSLPIHRPLWLSQYYTKRKEKKNQNASIKNNLHDRSSSALIVKISQPVSCNILGTRYYYVYLPLVSPTDTTKTARSKGQARTCSRTEVWRMYWERMLFAWEKGMASFPHVWHGTSNDWTSDGDGLILHYVSGSSPHEKLVMYANMQIIWDVQSSTTVDERQHRNVITCNSSHRNHKLFFCRSFLQGLNPQQICFCREYICDKIEGVHFPYSRL